MNALVSEPTRSRRARRGWVLLLTLAVLAAGAGLLTTTDLWQAMRVQARASSWKAEQPGGTDRITPRMRTVREAAVEEFGIQGTPGCYREESGGGEHPLGRACDIMLGPAGKKATGEADALGEKIVAWAREHADEYGIWYVMYEQHIWSSRRPQEGWKKLEDRGSVTLNHYDHVHISVY